MLTREQTLAALANEIDVLVIGGGINGAVSAAALAAHGVNVGLVEANDFASMTSQESSNMIWGGIKYLQDYEFSLVWSLCRSRNQLLSKYPNRVKQIPFFAIIGPTSPFSRLLGYLGALLYWMFGRFKTQRPKIFSNSKIKNINSILNLTSAKGAIQYNDAILLDNDARFVYEFIKSAAKNNAMVLNYAEVQNARRTSTGWQVSIIDKVTNQQLEIKAKCLVNATGPYAKSISDSFEIPSKNQIVISKGVHLIVPRIDTNEKVFAFFDNRGRLFYVLPMHDRTVIGTTDTPAENPAVTVTEEDREFLLEQANRCLNLKAPLNKSDIIAERCGVRPLVVSNAATLDNVDWISLSRKHVVELNEELSSISIYGGKLTDCINVGYEVVDLVKKVQIKIGPESDWIGESITLVPGSLIDQIAQFHPNHANEIADQLWRRHGSDALEIVKGWKARPEEAELLFSGLFFTYGEIAFIIKNEHIVSKSDLLRRRTPISLLRKPEEISSNMKLQNLMANLPD